jgi:Zn-dependent protease with chaperone function
MKEILENLPENLISFLVSPIWNNWLLITRAVFIIVSLFLIGLIIFTLFKTSWLKYIFFQDATEILTYRPFGVKKMEKDWRKIVARLDAGLEPEYKLAVIEADNMMNEILKRMGYGGASLGERLEKLTAATLPNIDEVKEVHKVRNNIVHDPNYKLSLEEAKRTLSVFEKALRDLEAF